VASIIGTAIIPTLIANTFFLPRHLLPPPEPELAPLRPAEVKAASSVLGKVE
jgi:glutathione-regulated potassium-efflux system ancillary protein KefC